MSTRIDEIGASIVYVPHAQCLPPSQWFLLPNLLHYLPSPSTTTLPLCMPNHSTVSLFHPQLGQWPPCNPTISLQMKATKIPPPAHKNRGLTSDWWHARVDQWRSFGVRARGEGDRGRVDGGRVPRGHDAGMGRRTGRRCLSQQISSERAETKIEEEWMRITSLAGMTRG
jgi:hypothetical protein